MSSRPWWDGPTPEESEPLDKFAAAVRTFAATVLRALAGDLQRLAGWVAPRLYDAAVEDRSRHER